MMKLSQKNNVRRRTWILLIGVMVLINLVIFSVLAVYVLDYSKEAFHPTPTPIAIQPTVTLDLQVPIVAPILPEMTATPETTPVPVPAIEVQSALLEAPDRTSNVYVEYILDASGSMMGQLADHTRKRDVAEKVLTSRISSLPPQMHIGFRTFGHHMDWRNNEDASCKDIELVAPVETGQLETIVPWLKNFQAQGMTPLAQSIRFAIEDFPNQENVNNAIILISDGKETCGGDPCAIVQELKDIDIHFTLHVIGLNVQQEDEAQLFCVAKSGQGFYKTAQTVQEMNQALEDIEEHIAEGNQPIEIRIPPTATPQPTATNTSVIPTATATPTATPTPDVDLTDMVFVPAGEFTMGNNESYKDNTSVTGYSNDRQPEHSVYLDGFYIDKYEVTNALFRQCVDAGVCNAPTNCDGGNPTYDSIDKDKHPVVCVNWNDANTYCKWAGKQLPTEAQWEKAARGTDKRTYPWGNDFDCKKVNAAEEPRFEDGMMPRGDDCDGFEETAPVGSFPSGVSPFGVYDMAGNVEEWVADWYDDNYYANAPTSNPTGPSFGSSRVLRGGSWNFYANYYGHFLKSYNRRGNYDPDTRSYVIGFRCAVSNQNYFSGICFSKGALFRKRVLRAGTKHSGNSGCEALN